MAAPEGYTELGRIGFVDKGNYASGTTYRTGDVVYYNGSTWVALKDNLRGVTPAPEANWKYMARGFAAEALSAITAVDTSGVLREAGASVTSQELIDAIADKVMTKLIEKSKIVNNLLATDATTVLSGPMGKSLDDKITQLNSDLTAMVIGNKKITWNIYCVVTTDENGNCNIPFGYTFADTDICVIPMVAYSYEQCSASVRGVNTTGFSVSVNVAGQHWTNKEITLIWVAIGNK